MKRGIGIIILLVIVTITGFVSGQEEIDSVKEKNEMISEFSQIRVTRPLLENEQVELERIVMDRKEEIRALLEKGTEMSVVIDLLFDQDEINDLSEEVKFLLERRVVEEGYVEIYGVDDFENEKGEIRYELHQNPINSIEDLISDVEREGEQFFFEENEHSLTFGDYITVSGYDFDGFLIVDEIEAEREIRGEPEGGGAELRHFGDQRYAVILVGFNNVPFDFEDDVNIDFSNEEELNEILSETSEFFERVSGGRTTTSYDVFGPWDLPIAFTCYENFISSYGLVEFRREVENWRDYSRFIFIFMEPDWDVEREVPGCRDWGGLGTVGGRVSVVWLKSDFVARSSITHEIGHNFGLEHANLLDCGDETMNLNLRTCTSYEYGDTGDMMGYGLGDGVPNYYLKQKLQWVGPANKQRVESTGMYEIQRRREQGDTTRSLEIPWLYGAINYLEYEHFRSGHSLMLRIPWINNGGETQMIRMDPFGETSFERRYMGLGKSYYDPARELSITFMGVEELAAQVYIDFEPNEFVRGDVNEDQIVDLSDAIYILNYLFQSGTRPVCFDAADANDDGYIDVSDVVYILLYLFGGGQEPPAPFGGIGVDPTLDGISCLRNNEFHLECVDLSCQSVVGEGENECSSDNDCSHLECIDLTCQTIVGEGVDNCNVEGEECSHLECVDLTCQAVSGEGVDSCDSDNDCSHLECVELTCQVVAGEGTNSCDFEGEECLLQLCGDSDISETYSNGMNFFEKGTADVPFFTSGYTDWCSAGFLTEYYCDEIVKAVRYECPEGCNVETDYCLGDDDLGEYHLECRNRACTVVEGVGESTCSSSIDCNPCTDSDVTEYFYTGFNVYVQGTLELPRGSITDYCIDENSLNEYSCLPTGRVASSNRFCDNGCVEGACIR